VSAALGVITTKGVPMINRKHHKIVFAFLMALLMSCIMSFVISVFNVGLVSNIVHVWLKAWAFAFIVAFPTITIVAPIVHKLVSLVLKKESSDT
jgi:TctA family transporter